MAATHVTESTAKPTVPGSHFSQLRREVGHPQFGMNGTLFNGIVRGFASNHHIVDVALAQARAADAHEPRFLQ